MAQSKEGQADEAERREKRYEELGQMLVQIDEFILALTRLEEALKKDDTETAIREAETAKYLAEKREALKQKIAAKARELVGPNGNENELKSFCRVHQALGVLRQEAIIHRMSIAPILKSRGKNSQKESLGVSTSQQVLNKINTNKLRRAVIAYDRAVESYVEEFGSDRPPQKALSVEALLERQPDDLFWSDVLFDSRDEPWASDLHCIQALFDRDRNYGTYSGYGLSGCWLGKRGNEDVELDNFPSRDFCIRSLFLVSVAREAHRILELHWVRDGLVRAWKGQPDPELWRSRCDPALRKDWEEKWEGIDAEIEEMLTALERRVLTCQIALEGRGTMDGAVDFSVIRQEIEKLPDKAGNARELIGMIARGSGESSSETGTSEAMDIDVPPNDQPREGDGDWTGIDEELLVLDDEVSDDDLADAMEMVSLSHVN
ncbi:hypothetical protein C345_00928 [Cryptococcus neoformans A2-102-5]|nr:hypothetical protein C345_00928 [Cryptococcus neoformans var. grubii A2-102-5]